MIIPGDISENDADDGESGNDETVADLKDQISQLHGFIQEIQDRLHDHRLEAEGMRKFEEETRRRIHDDEPTPSATAPAGTLFAANVTENGGTAGDENTACSFKYDVFDTITDEQVGAGLTVEMARFIKTTYTAATRGMYYRDSVGVAHLLWVDEQTEQFNCTE